jgi:hypothetical protein
VTLEDKSVVTYFWYRFMDQPSLADADLSGADLSGADLSGADRTRLQAIVEKIHAESKCEKDYMAPPKRGKPAALDPALIVRPPKGMEVGFVPIATSQTPGR